MYSRRTRNQTLAPLQERYAVSSYKACEAIEARRGSIIFGLSSFAEGVDLPGKLCSHVIIAKLPFSVPTSPVEAATAEWIESKGGSPFMKMSMPDCSLKLIQAAGRLIRTETDSGRLTILDRRLVNSRWGKLLLDALPPFKRIVESVRSAA